MDLSRIGRGIRGTTESAGEVVVGEGPREKTVIGDEGTAETIPVLGLGPRTGR